MINAVRRAIDCYQLGLEQADACSPLPLAMRIKRAQLYLHAIFDRRDVAVQSVSYLRDYAGAIAFRDPPARPVLSSADPTRTPSAARIRLLGAASVRETPSHPSHPLGDYVKLDICADRGVERWGRADPWLPSHAP
jgi:hypothetical protein